MVDHRRQTDPVPIGAILPGVLSSIRRRAGRTMFNGLYAALNALRRHGHPIAARRLYSMFWRSGLRDVADRMERGLPR